MTNPLYTNRLIYQKSPYLLQHAHNPVNWFAWGEEAFQAAKEKNLPIFLSIGYATCHWCHVMEKESFEDIEVAELMNRHFINIKVDREELPDVDGLYMEFAQSMMSGAAGWPLNIILTPHLEPFFAATYLPPYSAHGMMGLTDLIEHISELWNSEEQQQVIEQAQKIVEVFAESVHSYGEKIPEPDFISLATDLLYKMADPIYGGIKGAPKFPIGYQYRFMMNEFLATQDMRALYLVEKTLVMMYRGGIYDHLGGGFSRYSIDEKWLIPHFEKMLYDNAILAQTYLEAWQITKKPLYQSVARQILNYILAEMTHQDGGFYSAEDADSEGHEGLYYLWTKAEIQQVLAEEADLFCKFYNVSEEGNFEGKNILHITLSIEEFAIREGLDLCMFSDQLEKQKIELLKVRKQRCRPFQDDKILCAWNGLMIYSLTKAGVALDHLPYLQAAVKGAHFIEKALWKEGRLLRRWRQEEAFFSAGLEDYAYLIRGLIALFEANSGVDWLLWAIHLSQILEEKFKEEEGAFYQTDGLDPSLIIRKCQFSDGAEPSGNAVHTENLLKLFQITGKEKYLIQAEDILRAVKEYLESYSPGYCYHLMNLDYYYDDKAHVIVVAYNENKELEQELKKLLFENYHPHRVVIWRNEDLELQELIPILKEQKPIDQKTTLYLCYETHCEKPLTSWQKMRQVIEKI